MNLKRIKAVYTENREEVIVVNCMVDKNNRLIPEIEFYGYTADYDEDSGSVEKYPFTANCIDRHSAVLEYGAAAEYETDRINLPEKEIKINEYFTRIDDNEYTYRIEAVTTII